MTVRERTSQREVKRRETRERIFGASVAEFKRAGLAEADVREIVSSAGVAHGTFYFHFPTKEHVLVELERREETRIVAELGKSLKGDHNLEAVLNETVAVVTDLERRLGSRLFKDFLALHFSTSRPPAEEWAEHPIVVAVVDEIERARQRGETNGRTESFHLGVFFLLGLYGLLITISDDKALRTPILEQFVATSLHGMVAP
ncbi:TetR/AcrR family transcriptional regulator [Aldersonia kunmingensis]|uniref:TetR/AcrR family transcriptional regulator n=1 Tax=Aldersonia kunmingensis TaxID=408066 RepID=UPI0008336FF1|nr:TetR/AcrR family transcriptional regulator [Aldersonia kunmingensis]